ncbi:hypothetical protein KIW84_075583 [Lathyrus oleraceus]|uniref:Uncharacterized protein n=1 Tax=Pisum sativum TaxID=3888 RepID=A0A9D4VVL0_PEA|nr:hypothetical protein KIW84_075583 [Pisum sativum]
MASSSSQKTHVNVDSGASLWIRPKSSLLREEDLKLIIEQVVDFKSFAANGYPLSGHLKNKALQKEVEEVASKTEIMSTKTRIGGTCQSPVKEIDAEPALKKKNLSKIILPVEEEEEEEEEKEKEEVHMKRKAGQQVETLMSSLVIDSTILIAAALVENTREVT